MTKDQLIEKILTDIFRKSNTSVNFFDEFSSYENDVNKLESVKASMENEGLITNFKNLKTGITPLGFKVAFEGGYLNDKNKKERQLKRTLKRNQVEITYLKKSLRSKNRSNSILLFVIIICLSIAALMAFGIIGINIK